MSSPSSSSRPRTTKRSPRGPPLRRASLLTPSVASISATTTTTVDAEFPPFVPATQSSPSPINLPLSDPIDLSTPDLIEPATEEPVTEEPIAFPSTDPAESLLEASMTSPLQRSDSDASLKKRSNSRSNSLFGSIGSGSLHRRTTSNGSISDGGGSAPALSSLLETQKKDQAARKLQKDRPDGNTSGVGSESESEGGPKKISAVKRTLTRVLSGYRRRKTSDAGASAGEEVASRGPSVDVATSPIVAIDTSAAPAPVLTDEDPNSVNLMSPVVEEAQTVTVYPTESQNVVIDSPTDDVAINLGSAPSSPVAPAPPATFALSPEASAVLVPAAAEVDQAADDHVSAITKMTAVSSAAAGSQFAGRPVEEEAAAAAKEQEELEHDAEWEQINASRMQNKSSILGGDEDGGSLADDDESSFGERPRGGPSFVAALKEKSKAASHLEAEEDEAASTNAQLGEDATDPSQRVPGTPFIASSFAAAQKDIKVIPPGVAADFTPPITPDSEKFPLLRGGSKRGLVPSKLSTTIDEKSAAATKETSGNAMSPSDLSSPGGLSNLIPSRDTVDTAAQYATQASTSATFVQAPPQGQASPVPTPHAPGYYEGFDVPAPGRPSSDAATQASPNRPSTFYTAPASTVSSQPASPFVTAYHTPAIALRQLHRDRTISTATTGIPSTPPPPPPPPPAPVEPSLWDLIFLPVTVPMAASRIALSFSFRAFVFGVVFGVTIVKLGSRAVNAAIFGRRV